MYKNIIKILVIAAVFLNILRFFTFATTNFKYKNIIIGDSRMYDILTNDNIKKDNDTKIIAKNGASCNYLETAIEEVEKYVKENNNYKFRIYLNLGVNDLNNVSKMDKVEKYCSVEGYFKKYQMLIENEWEKHEIYFISINPIDNEEMLKGKYKNKNRRTNEEIMIFNEKMQYYIKDTKIKYCNTSQLLLVNGFETRDGLHYTEETSKDIYRYISFCK